jgi:hypothetical protein
MTVPIDWLTAPDYTLSRMLIERGLAAIYLFAFVVVLRQFPALLGQRGLLPVADFVAGLRLRQVPSLFVWRYSDGLLRAVGWVGVLVATALLLGVGDLVPLPIAMAAWLLLWALYLSIVNVGQAFYSFGWESLLLEAGFLAIFLGNDEVLPPTLVLLLFRWLAFRVEFGAGLIKLRGDPCWRNLTCLDYHHETQPMPNPLSWYAHHLPRRFHRLEVLGNHVAQLVVPFGLFLPQPFAGLAATYMILTQLYLVVTGNYAWLNWVTIVVTVAALPDSWLGLVLPTQVGLGQPAPWFVGLSIALAAVVVVLSYWPVRNLMGRRQMMNFSFNALHLVNTYGAFGSVTRSRDEVVIEGTADLNPGPESTWLEYEFKGKPGDLRHRPPQVAPYHLRLDWLMWFLPLSPIYGESWFVTFLERLLLGDELVLGLLRLNPFAERPPAVIRARLYRYRFTTWRERRTTGAWWARELIGDFLPALRLSPGGTIARAGWY